MADKIHVENTGNYYLIAGPGNTLINTFCEQHFTDNDFVAFFDVAEMVLYHNEIPVGHYDHPQEVIAYLSEQEVHPDICWIFDPGASDLTQSLLLKTFLSEIQKLSIAVIRYVGAACPFQTFRKVAKGATWQWIIPPAVLTDTNGEYLFTGLLDELGAIITEINRKVAGFWEHYVLPIKQHILSWPCEVVAINDFLVQLHALPAPTNANEIIRFKTAQAVQLQSVISEVWSVAVSPTHNIPDETLAILVNELLSPYDPGDISNVKNLFIDNSIHLQNSVEPILSWWQSKQTKQLLSETDLFSVMQEKHLTADVMPVRYYIGGTGNKTILIINALGLTMRFWLETIGLLMKYCKVIVWETQCCDLWEGGMERVITIDQHAAVIQAIIDQENIVNCHLTGWCNGGRIAIAAAAKYPKEIASVSLICPVFRGINGIASEDTQFEKDQQEVFAAVSRNPAIAGVLASYLINTNAKQPDPRTDPAVVLSFTDRSFRSEVIAPMRTGHFLINYAQRTFNDENYPLMDLIPGVQQPTLVMLGTEDAVISNDLAEIVSSHLSNYRQVTLMGASHYIQLQQPALLVHLLHDFIYTGKTRQLHQRVICNSVTSLEY